MFNKGGAVIRVKPVSSLKNNSLSFFFPLPLSIKLLFFDVPLHFDVGAISRGTFVPLGRQAVHSTDPHPYELNGEN